MDINITGIDESTGAIVFKEMGAAFGRIADRMGGLTIAADEATEAVRGVMETTVDTEPAMVVDLEEALAKEILEAHEHNLKAAEEVIACYETAEVTTEPIRVQKLENGELAVFPLEGSTPEPDAATAEVTPTATEAPQLDSAGLPWDERIHAGTRTKVAAGTWKWKPKTDQAFKDMIVAELRLTYPEPAKPSTQTDSAGYPVKDPSEVFAASPAPAAEPTATDAPYNFVSLLAEIRAAVTSGEVAQETLDQITSILFPEFGVTGWVDLQPKPDLILPFRSRLDNLLGPR